MHNVERSWNTGLVPGDAGVRGDPIWPMRILKVKWEMTNPFKVECLPAAWSVRKSFSQREVE